MDAGPILFRTVGTVAKPGQMVDGGKGGGSFESLRERLDPPQRRAGYVWYVGVTRICVGSVGSGSGT